MPIPSKNSNNENIPRTDSVKASISNLLAAIPSRILTPEEIEQARRASNETRSRRSQISKMYSEQRKMSMAVTEPRRDKPQTDPIVLGKVGTLKLCYDIGIDQLSCHYNEDFTLFASGGSDGVVRLYDTVDFNFIRSINGGKEIEGLTSCVTCIKHKPVHGQDNVDNQFTCSYVNGVVKCFNYKTQECVFTINEKRQTYGLIFHPKFHKFITYGDDLKINLYDYETQAKERVFMRSGIATDLDGHTSRVFAARFNPKSTAEFLSGGWDNTVFLWDIRKPHGVRHISDVPLCGEGLDIDQHGKQVLTCAWRKDSQIQLWDYSTFKLISNITPDKRQSRLYCGKFIGDDFLVCGGGEPSVFRVVDRVSEKTRFLVTNLSSDVNCLAVGTSESGEDQTTKKKRKHKASVPLDDVPSQADISNMPKVMFLAGEKIYQISFPHHA